MKILVNISKLFTVGTVRLACIIEIREVLYHSLAFSHILIKFGKNCLFMQKSEVFHDAGDSAVNSSCFASKSFSIILPPNYSTLWE